MTDHYDHLEAIADTFREPLFHEAMTGAERQRRRNVWARRTRQRRPPKVSLAYLAFLASEPRA